MYQDLDSFATAVSIRGMGFRDPQLMALVPRSANIRTRNGVSYEPDDEVPYRRGTYWEESATAPEVGGAVPDAAHSESGLRAAPRRIRAFDIQMAKTRRATRAGF